MQISITLLIIAFTVIVSMQAFGNYGILDKLRHHPVRESGMREYYRLLSSGFVHADWMHLIINMFVLYNFGEMIEAYVIHLFGAAKGRVIFLLLYLLNIVLANLPTAFRHRHDPGFSSIGASGEHRGVGRGERHGLHLHPAAAVGHAVFLLHHPRTRDHRGCRVPRLFLVGGESRTRPH